VIEATDTGSTADDIALILNYGIWLVFVGEFVSLLSPAQGDELDAAEAGEGGGEVDRGVLPGVGRAHERHDFLDAEDVDAGGAALGRLLDVARRVERKAVGATRALEDPKEQRADLDLRRLERAGSSSRRQRSSWAGVRSSIGTAPKAGSMCVRRTER
jgi:hypothetical protein